MEQKKNRLHYAWFILAGCCILQGATLGLINNCAGVFYSPICKELGFELGKLTLYRMLYCISSALALPFVAKSFRKHDVRIVISIAAVVYGVCAVLMGTFRELWQWHVTGIIQGIASSFVCMIPAPIILGNWFKKKTGTAVGISAAFSGLVGMIGSSCLGMAIPAFGWRMSYVAVGIVSIALVLPISLFILRYKPEEMGLLPYGAKGCIRHISACIRGKRDSDKRIAASAGILYCRRCILDQCVVRVPEFLPDALWDRSRPDAAGGGHDDEYIPSRKHVQQADPRKGQRQPWDHKDLRIFHCAGVLWSCAAVPGLPEDCDGGFPVLRCDIAAFLGHDAIILQDLLEGRDI